MVKFKVIKFVDEYSLSIPVSIIITILYAINSIIIIYL